MDDHCDECGFDGRSMTIDTVIESLRQLPPQISAVVTPVDPARLRMRLQPDTWSALEYLGHLRDLMAYHRWLVEQAVVDDQPVLAAPDPDAAVANSGFQDADRDELLAQFARRVERLAVLLEGLSPPALDRPLIIDRPIDVRLVARSALHEGYHHRADLARIVATSS
jgi:hypothetical protein